MCKFLSSITHSFSNFFSRCHEKIGKENYHVGKERLKVHVFEPGVQRTAQFNHLLGNTSRMRGPPGQPGLSRTGQAWGPVVLSREAHCQGRRERKTGKPKGLGKERQQEIGKGGTFGRDSISPVRVRVICVEVGRQDTEPEPLGP